MRWLTRWPHLLALTSLLGLAVACGGGAGAPADDSLGTAADFWSGASASTWLFDGRDHTHQDTPYRNRVTSGAPLARFGRTLVRFDHSRPIGNPPAQPAREYRSHSDEGIRAFIDDDPGSLSRSYIELPARIARGSYRAYEGIDSVDGETGTLRIDVTIAGLESLSLPAGTVARALKTATLFALTRQRDGATRVRSLTRWYVKGLGVVKTVLDDPGVSPAAASHVEELAGVVVPGMRAGVVGDFALLDALAPGGAALSTGRPGIASDGSGFLVAARALDAAGTARIDAAYFDRRGQTLWRKTVIEAAWTGVPEYGPVAVAFDGVEFWIAAYTEDAPTPGTVVQRVTAAGELREVPAGRYVSSGEAPSLASNGMSVLLATSEYSPPHYVPRRVGILFRRDGSVLRSDLLLGHDVWGSRMTARNDQYLVTLDQVNVRALRIDAAGNVIGGPVDISTGPQMKYGSVAAPRGDGYVAMWIDARNHACCRAADVYGARLAADGTLVDGPASSGGVALNRADSERHGLGVADGAQGTLAAWTLGPVVDLLPGPPGIYAHHFAPGGAFGVADPNAKGRLIQGVSGDRDKGVELKAPAVAASAEGFAVAWVRLQQHGGGRHGVHGALVYPPLAAQ